LATDNYQLFTDNYSLITDNGILGIDSFWCRTNVPSSCWLMIILTF